MRKAALVSCLLLLSAGIHAEDRMSRFDSFFAPGDAASYSFWAEPGGRDHPRIYDQSLRGSAVLSKKDDQTWSVTGRATQFEMNHELAIPGTGVRFPDELWDVQGGVSYLHRLGDRRQWGLNASVGSASDELFHSIHETSLQTTASYRKPSGPLNSWLFFLTYSNNRAFGNRVPLPGFAYLFRDPQRGVQMTIGFPFVLIAYTPNPDWSAHVSLFGTTNQSAEISRRIDGTVRAYVAYDHNPTSWFRAGRANTTDRLIDEEKRAVVGMRAPVARNLSIDVSGGRTFGRRFFEAKDVRSANVSHLSVGDGWLAAINLSLRLTAADR